MPKLNAVILITLFAASAFAASAPKVWTLQAAMERALASNPDAAIAQSSVDRAQAISEQADSTLYPKIAANVGYAQTNNPMVSFGNILNQGTFDNSINFNDPGRTDAFTAGIYFRYPIFTGGANSSRREAARRQTEASSLEKDAVYNNLKIETVRSFFAILQAQAMKKSVSETIASLEQGAKNARNLQEAGKMLKSERLNIEVQLLKAREALLSVSQQLSVSKRRFASILDIDDSESIEVNPSELSTPRFDISEKDADNPRPEITALQRRIDSAGSNVDAQIGLYFPTVSIVGGYDYDKGWVRSGDGGSWNAGVVVEVPIFDGMLTRAKVREAKAIEAAARHELRKLELSLGLEKQRAELSCELISRQQKLVDAQLEQARESLQIVSERFKAGSALSVELLRAESTLAEIKLRNDILKSSKAVAAAELRRAKGLEIFKQEAK